MRQFLLLLAVLLPLPAGALEKVVLQLKWKHQFQFAGYYAAQEKGYYRQAGLEVSILEAGPSTDPVREVLDGRAHFGVSNSALILARARGEPVRGSAGGPAAVERPAVRTADTPARIDGAFAQAAD